MRRYLARSLELRASADIEQRGRDLNPRDRAAAEAAALNARETLDRIAHRSPGLRLSVGSLNMVCFEVSAFWVLGATLTFFARFIGLAEKVGFRPYPRAARKGWRAEPLPWVLHDELAAE